MSIAATAIGEAAIAGGPASQPAPKKVPPKRRTSAIADRQSRPEAR